MKKIVKQLLELEPQITSSFAQHRVDYRGRIIRLDHVLRYFYLDLYREAELVKVILETDNVEHILDVGIAYGFWDVVLKTQYSKDITGVELSDNISVYCDLPKQADIPLLPGEIGVDIWPVEPELYDLVVFGEVLEHLRCSPFRALKQLGTVLRPNGYLLLTTPNIAYLTNIARLVLGRNLLEQFPDDDTGLKHITDGVVHIREYVMSEVKDILERSGFTIEKAWHSWSWDRHNSHLTTFEQTSVVKRMMLFARAGLTWIMPFYRREMMFLARKK